MVLEVSQLKRSMILRKMIGDGDEKESTEGRKGRT
jgi:hypothetical protein